MDRARIEMRVGVLITVLALGACGQPVRDEPISGPYRVFATDIPSDAMLCHDTADGNGCVGRVPAEVVQVGHNDRYVVAARRNGSADSSLEYFYVDRALDGPLIDPGVSVTGPLTAEAFETERARLNLPELRPID